MKYITLMVFGLVAAPTFSQTKLIAHRSHSGSDAHFSLHSPDNFGELPNWGEINKQQVKEIKIQAEQDTTKKIKPVVADSAAIDTSNVNVQTEEKNKATAVPLQEKKQKRRKSKTKKDVRVSYSKTIEDDPEVSGKAINEKPKKAGTSNVFGLILLLLVPGIFVFAGSFRKTNS